MDLDDDYVIVSPDLTATYTRPEPTTSVCHNQVVQPSTSASKQHPKPFTRAYIELLHDLHSKWGAPTTSQTVSGGILGSEPAYLRDVNSSVDSIADALWIINQKIHDNPELGFKEYLAHETLTNLLRSQDGWKVTPSVYGMETAWVAIYDSGTDGPVVSFNAEMGEC